MTTWQVSLIPIFTDNYVFVIQSGQDNRCIIVDPGSDVEVQDYLIQNNLIPEAIFLTHHHSDHIDGVRGILEFSQGQFNSKPQIFAPAGNKIEIPWGDRYVKEGDRLDVLGLSWDVIELPGHTLAHVAYFNPQNRFLFSGDVLFGLGCGRLFEGTYEQQYHSLQKIKALPEDTQIFCTHEYTLRNLEFCKQILSPAKIPAKLNELALAHYESTLRDKRSQNIPSVPLTLATEMEVNPFLLSADIKEFTQVRKMRNSF
jgi:hydroxyacylglutathione hydrolase